MERSIYSVICNEVRSEVLRDLLLDAVGVSPIMSTYHEMLRCTNTEESLVERHCNILEQHYTIIEDTTYCEMIFTDSVGTKVKFTRSVSYDKYKSAVCECMLSIYDMNAHNYLGTCELDKQNPYLLVAGADDHFAIVVRPFKVLKENTEEFCRQGKLCKEYLAYE